MPRKSTGLKRPIQVPCFFDADEHEFLERKVFKLRVSKTEYMRRGVLKQGWRSELLRLRQEQRQLPTSDFRRLPANRSTDISPAK